MWILSKTVILKSVNAYVISIYYKNSQEFPKDGVDKRPNE